MKKFLTDENFTKRTASDFATNLKLAADNPLHVEQPGEPYPTTIRDAVERLIRRKVVNGDERKKRMKNRVW